MKLPERINTESELEDLLAEPSESDLESVSRLSLSGDVLVVGAGGKMGPSLTRRIHRALRQTGRSSRMIAASRFSSSTARASPEADGISTIACDVLDRRQVEALPQCESVLLLAGRKFGTLDRTDLTWGTTQWLPPPSARAPLAVRLTGANRHDSQEALSLLDAIPPLHGERGRPRCRPQSVLGDRGYDAAAIRRGLRARHIMPWLAMRRTEHGSGLGRWRWVVE